jgi:hypothetical protein
VVVGGIQGFFVTKIFLEGLACRIAVFLRQSERESDKPEQVHSNV